MGWFTSLFSPSKNSRNSRSAISSTHEAFSLPMSSSGHPGDVYNPGTPSTPEPPSAATSTYSYPPSSPTGAYDYVPAATGSHSRRSTLLPLHGVSAGNGTAPYPPLEQTWARLRQWLANEYPELGDTLNYGILPQDLTQVEMALGLMLPPAVRDSYLCADGQEAESAAGCSDGLFFGLTLLPLEDVLEEWRFWREVDEDPNTGANPRLKELMNSVPPGWVRKEYSSRGWIPIVKDKAGNYLGVDMNPGEGGQVGQVIVFGRDFDTKVVMHRGQGYHGWASFLAGFVEDLESGEGFELGTSNDAGEGSEDSVGYESYFFDGIGRGLGDGGGDTGTGGMRLTGEYKGWPVLEAWADHSVRKLHTMGLVPSEPVTKGKTTEKLPDETVRSVSGIGLGAEVPIPIIVDSTEPSTSNRGPLPDVTNRDSYSQQPLPTISVTKPPAPKPVDLPTQDDIIIELDAAAAPPSHMDIEAGGDMAMREISSSIPPSRSNTIQSTSSASTLRQSGSTILPAPIPPPPTSPRSPYTTPSRTPTSPKIDPPFATIAVSSEPRHDLLADSPSLQFSKVTPPTITTSEPSSSVHSEDSPVLVAGEDTRPPSLDIGLSISSGEESSNEGVLVSEPEAESPQSTTNDALPAKSSEKSKPDLSDTLQGLSDSESS